MPDTMAKQQKPAKEPWESIPRGTSIRLNDSTRKAIWEWVRTQRVEPSVSAVVLKSLQEFLEREGFPVDPE